MRVREWVVRTLAQVDGRVLLDAPCGDFTWMQAVDLHDATYFGIDVVEEIIAENRSKFEKPGRTFLAGDLRSIVLPPADLVLCRDCLVHLSFHDGLKVLANFRRNRARYLAATTFPGIDKNRDITTGGWRPINLSIAPYALGEPAELLLENPESEIQDEKGKCLGLWSLRS